MTTTTLLPIPPRLDAPRGGRSGGFTMVEVMISSALAGFLLTAVMTTFLFLGRSGLNLQNYTDMETQARRSLEQFAEDARQASGITWTSSTQMQLTVNTIAITYAYDATNGKFNRTINGTTTTLITGIVPNTFTFRAYNVLGTELALATATNLAAATSGTKQLQISLQARRTSTTTVNATNLVLSARYILRNKIVTA